MIKRTNTRYLVVGGLIILGIALRFYAMTFGHNYDFDSYCIVGEISGNLRSVYAETHRYNYGPVFFCLLGLLYRISRAVSDDWIAAYRILIVSCLTLADLGITAYISNKYSTKKALFFFLNPVSIIITGCHNQFDNIAVLLALISTIYFNEEERINKKDILFILFFSLSLITKHILFLLPIFILLMERLSIKKKMLYSCFPVLFFLLSFVPFFVSSPEARQGIINNVFLYRSYNNAPLLSFVYDVTGFPPNLKIIVYGLMMVVLAWIIRRRRFNDILLLYFIAMVSFASAIANQYLAIPMVALCALEVLPWNLIYVISAGTYLALEGAGLDLLQRFQNNIRIGIISKSIQIYVGHAYVLAAWILLLSLMKFILDKNEKIGE